MKNELFDLFHISHIIISLLVVIVVIYLTKKYFKTQTQKDTFLKYIGILTFISHYLPLWFVFLSNGEALIIDNMLFPIYYCNLTMLLLLITSLSNKEKKSFKYLAVLTSYASIIGALITIFYPDFYIGEGSEGGVFLFKSLLSHDFMLIGGLLLLTGNYFEIKHKNTLYYFIGLLFYGFVGLIINFLFYMNNLEDPNAMYLSHPPIDDVRFLNVYVITILMLLVISLLHYLYLKVKIKKTILT